MERILKGVLVVYFVLLSVPLMLLLFLPLLPILSVVAAALVLSAIGERR